MFVIWIGPLGVEWWYFVFRKVICATSTTLIAFDGFSSWPNPTYKISRIQTCGEFACSLAHTRCVSHAQRYNPIRTHTHTHMCAHTHTIKRVCVAMGKCHRKGWLMHDHRDTECTDRKHCYKWVIFNDFYENPTGRLVYSNLLLAVKKKLYVAVFFRSRCFLLLIKCMVN